MVKAYLVRHAEAQGNVREFFQGHIDTEVSEKGRKQLECLAEHFKNIDFDRIYSSPLKRTVSTAEAVNRYHGKEIIYDSGLVEINGGVWEGVKWADLPVKFPAEYDLWVNRMYDFSVENGEKMTDVFERMKKTVGRIVRENEGKTIVIVSHGCALRNYLCYANGDDITHLKDVGWSDNTAVSLVEYDENFNPHIIFKNSSDHLDDGLSTLAHSNWCKVSK